MKQSGKMMKIFLTLFALTGLAACSTPSKIDVVPRTMTWCQYNSTADQYQIFSGDDLLFIADNIPAKNLSLPLDNADGTSTEPQLYLSVSRVAEGIISCKVFSKKTGR